MWGARGTTIDPGPMRHQTAGIRVSRRMDSRIGIVGAGSASQGASAAEHRWARARPPTDSNPLMAKYETPKLSSASVTPTYMSPFH